MFIGMYFRVCGNLRNTVEKEAKKKQQTNQMQNFLNKFLIFVVSYMFRTS